MDFKHGKYLKDGGIHFDLLKEAEKEATKESKHITLVSRQTRYDVSKLKDDMTKMCRDGIRLIVLDHLDYIEQDNPNENSNEHLTSLMSAIRELQDIYKCGIVAVSHFRKSENSKNMPLIPAIDEFHGSSNKAKQATCAIMLAPDYTTRQEDPTKDTKETFCCVRKHRDLGESNVAGQLFFNIHTGKYLNTYRLKSVNYQGTEIEDIGGKQ